MNNDPLSGLLKTAVTAARLAGDIIIKNLGHLSEGDIQSKKAFDFVTKVDRWSEAVIVQTIRDKYPTHSFLAEETLRQAETDSYRWIIDPLDGTTNYIHSYPVFSVSIALEYKGEIMVGVVFDPLKDELFHGIRGEGAFLNNSPIRVTEINLLSNSLIATGFPFRKKDLVDLYLQAFKSIFYEVSDLRRAGSAAIDLAYVAAGRFEGFFELSLGPWDIAAGSLLIQEAGGCITDFGGGKDYLSTGNVVAGNKDVHGEILEKIKKVFRGIIEK
jgi:myo-inositol-1(or 4)-monophosphatase